ncbi:hypothetical protein TNCV_2691841 [Trichonephila clavipes]|uniref:Uncharacterized protein n=1 Tax=Trichonephila clavipes TaxID=2585209 RepID=A0A8X7BAN5_TRICX|nr:hypothetical protein TNCV_2691841 [Trichonephila clavipes]
MSVCGREFHTNCMRCKSSSLKLTRMRPSWSHKLKRDSSEKTNWFQSACQAQSAHEPIADTAIDGLS